jgi:lipoate synthase
VYNRKQKKPKIIVASQNVRGLGQDENKLDDLTRTMAENNIDILMLTETWTPNRDEQKLDTGYLLLPPE